MRNTITINLTFYHSIFYSCTFNSTLEDLKLGKAEKDADVDPIWNDQGYCLCTKVILISI